ncbi:MAG: cation:proton antiporter [Gemmatimonadota bacterium]
MSGPLLGLAAILLLLALGGAILRRAGQSAVPVYILLGVATRTTVVDPDVVRFVEAIGVALLLFFVGLEFSILRLRRGARSFAVAGGIDLAINFPVGFLGGIALGWELPAALLLGAALYVSSSAIVAQNLFDLGRAAHPETELVLGILVAEDLIIALFLAGLSLWPSLSLGEVSPPTTIAAIIALILLLTVLADPLTRILDALFVRLDDEVLLLAISGFLLLFAGVSLQAGLSEAVGAFTAGLLVGNATSKARVEKLLAPFLGLFSALFFFGFGLTIEGSTLPPALATGLALAAVALGGKLLGGLAAGLKAKLSVAASVSLGLTLSPRGEFSVLLAAYGVALGHPELGPTVAIVVVSLAVAGTLLTQLSPRIGLAVQDLTRRRKPD